MLLIPKAVFLAYIAHLKLKKVPQNRHAEYQKWLRYYLDFCDKYPLPASTAERVRLFCEKLKDKKQSESNREHAALAVSLYLEMLRTKDSAEVAGSAVRWVLHQCLVQGSRLVKFRKMAMSRLLRSRSRHRTRTMFRRVRLAMQPAPRGVLNTPGQDIRKYLLHRTGTECLSA